MAADKNDPTEDQAKTTAQPESGVKDQPKTESAQSAPRAEESTAKENWEVKFGTGGGGGLGGIFKGVSSMLNLISDLAEKADQASSGQGENFSGEYRSGDRERGFVIHWGLNTSNLTEESIRRPPAGPGGRPSPFVRPTSRPAPSAPGRGATPGRTPARPASGPLNSDLAPTLREPYIEIHDEAEEGRLVVVVELPDVTPENLQVEVFDDVLIIHAQGSNCRYEKEVLLPAMVEPEPESYNFQNGLLEVRLRRLKS